MTVRRKLCDGDSRRSTLGCRGFGGLAEGRQRVREIVGFALRFSQQEQQPAAQCLVPLHALFGRLERGLEGLHGILERQQLDRPLAGARRVVDRAIDVSGGDMRTLDKKALKHDIDTVLNPP